MVFKLTYYICLIKYTSYNTDISPLVAKADDANMGQDAGVREVVRQLDKACREHGLFYLRGHGIPDSHLKEVKDVTHKFFHLPLEVKIKIKMNAATGYRGYEELDKIHTNGLPDVQEAIGYYKEFEDGKYGDKGKPMEGPNLWPSNTPNFKKALKRYFDVSTGLCRKIMRGIALALGGSGNEFEGKIAGDPFWIVRLIGYPPISKGSNGKPQRMGCGAHTNYGLLGLVNQDESISAIEVMNNSGEWISASPIPSATICIIGDMLKILSNGLYNPALHRIINASPKYCVSALYFYETNYDEPIEPLDICVQKSGGKKKLGTAIYGDYLVAKLKKAYPF
ncbi:probable 2-oxoglutarate-dependent dioxygenase At3g50210 [Chenopodium quinoa]|uniref:probable 2-oxoglutarate-dependent dioxygenase At3g50210 n=1 Tax=Chenopodium quinoa TaxID=63459 RepID=UPI000B77255D|nr:probable 2-oxoglutarate-dependent dioxygenase At3g50210 [Chenopodium quinoa]